MSHVKNTSPPASVSPNKKSGTQAATGWPATVTHLTPVRTNTSTDDSANRRTPRPTIPKDELSHAGNRQVDRLKVFKRSRPAYQEQEKYMRSLTTDAACDAFKDWSPSGQLEDP